jgi:hypothetical protein
MIRKGANKWGGTYIWGTNCNGCQLSCYDLNKSLERMRHSIDPFEIKEAKTHFAIRVLDLLGAVTGPRNLAKIDVVQAFWV